MDLEYTHRPNYFYFAQILINHIETYIQKHQSASDAIFDLRDIYDIFKQDYASTTINLNSILQIADEYKLETLDGDQKLIESFHIDHLNHSLLIDFNPEALASFKEGKPFIVPNANNYE